MEKQLMRLSLLERLTQADVCCRDCGSKYGKYSVGCSSVWEGTCDVCGETKPITEVRDWGYLGRGIQELKGNIKKQSKTVANYMETVGPIMGDDELEDCLTASYEQGEITLKLTEDEVAFLNECLDTIVENHPTLCPGHTNEDPEDVPLFEGIEKKITELYEHNCIRYELSPALKAYYAKYGEYGTGEYELRWEGFRDAFVAAQEGGNE
jgi:hypothetical protein